MTTTIKVSTELRDHLKEQAAREGLTLSAHLSKLAAAEDRRLRFEELRAAIDATPVEVRRGYDLESAEWERAELSDAQTLNRSDAQ